MGADPLFSQLSLFYFFTLSTTLIICYCNFTDKILTSFLFPFEYLYYSLLYFFFVYVEDLDFLCYTLYFSLVFNFTRQLSKHEINV